MKLSASVVIAALLISLLTVGPTMSAETGIPSSPLSTTTDRGEEVHGNPPGELILADALIVRPIGIVACAVGLVGAVLTWPFAATSGSGDRVGEELLTKPFDYTFRRPLGDLDSVER